MPLSTQEREALEEFGKRLKAEFGAKRVYLYGSKARGTDEPDSDVDVAVILPESSPEIESRMDNLAFEINLEHGCLMSPLYFTEKEISEGPMSESPIYKRVLCEGISI